MPLHHPVTIRENILLAPFTTFKIGGPARFFVHVHDERELREALVFAKEKALPVFFLGGGSNILVSDEGFPGVVVHLDIRGVIPKREGSYVRVRAGAGESWDALVAYAVGEGYWGIENLSGIPGTVGGAVSGNIGAYGQSVSQTFLSADVFDVDTGTVRTFGREECHFDYRHSVFRENSRYVVLSATFLLSLTPAPERSYKDLAERWKGGTPSLSDLRFAVLSIREEKFPDLERVGTAGSFFKNPVLPKEAAERLQKEYPAMPVFELPESSGVKVPAAWFLDKLLHWNGHRRGNVGVYERQALVPVNYGGASASEILELTHDMAESVKEKTGIVLEPEVVLVGF